MSEKSKRARNKKQQEATPPSDLVPKTTTREISDSDAKMLAHVYSYILTWTPPAAEPEPPSDKERGE